MDKVLALISAERLRDALVRLWVVADERVANDRALNAWESGLIPATHDRLRKQFLKLFAEGKSIGPLPAKQDPLALIVALDEHLAHFTPVHRVPRLDHEIDNARYWLVRHFASRRPNARVAGQHGNKSHWFRYHSVIPAEYATRGLRLKVQVREAPATTEARLKVLVAADAIRVFVGHFTDAARLTSEENAGGKKFFTGLTDEGARWTEIERQLDRAVERHADLIVFPELTVLPVHRERIHAWLRQRLDAGEPGPTLIVAGSFHERDKGRRVNRAELAGASGLILTHDKIRPFGKAEGVAENITTGGSIQIAMTSLGLVTIPICKDFNDAAGVDWQLLGPDWCLVPSMGDETSMRAHEGQAQRLGKLHFGTYSVVANQEAAGEPRPGLIFSKACEHVPRGGTVIELKLT